MDPLQLLNPGGHQLAAIPEPIRVLGIDLGTTNSVAAEVLWSPADTQSFNAQAIEIDQDTLSGAFTSSRVPSVVALHVGKEWIGEGAKMLYARSAAHGLELDRSVFLECKNEIGAQRTYHRAPEGYRSPTEISGRILRFLLDAASVQGDTPFAKTVVTVPASFQAAQRLETVKAAEFAGMDLSGGSLLDEPVAAFIDYLLNEGRTLTSLMAKPSKLLVFDFGGGTCDVAIFETTPTLAGQSLQISPLAVSRYHRLGGGDIDRAVLHEVLIPQILEQNGLAPSALDYEEKKNSIEPALIGVAEALKTGLCNEIHRLRAFGQYETTDKHAIVKIQPGAHPCRLKTRELQLQSPSLSAAQFEEMLKPFLDQDLLYSRETEYRLTCSVFAPLQDALDRCGLGRDDVDLCLCVGGSSLIPQVTDAIAEYLSKAQVLTYEDRESLQECVARGAAAHALALKLYGRGIFEVSTSDPISIRTKSGLYQLLPKGCSLPFPGESVWQQTLDLAVSESSLVKPVAMRVEILAGEGLEERLLLSASWSIPPPVQRGEKVKLEYQMDENQVLHLRLSMDGRPDAPGYQSVIENPLTNVVNPNSVRLQIQQAEEQLRRGEISKNEIPDKVVEIARLYSDMGQNEKAISYLKRALRMQGKANGYILNLLGIYTGEIQDYEGQEKFYREAAAAGWANSALFNLALSQLNQGHPEAASMTIQDLMDKITPDGPRLTLAAQIHQALGDEKAKQETLRQALQVFGDIRSMDNWSLGWFRTAAALSGDKDKLKKADDEKKKRARQGQGSGDMEGFLPEVAGTIQKI